MQTRRLLCYNGNIGNEGINSHVDKEDHMSDNRPILHMPPAIFKSAVSGKTYIVGGRWVEVPEGTRLKDAHKYVNYVKPVYETKTWQVRQYTVRKTGHGLTCSCPGFRWHRKCKHLKEVA